MGQSWGKTPARPTIPPVSWADFPSWPPKLSYRRLLCEEIGWGMKSDCPLIGQSVRGITRVGKTGGDNLAHFQSKRQPNQFRLLFTLLLLCLCLTFAHNVIWLHKGEMKFLEKMGHIMGKWKVPFFHLAKMENLPKPSSNLKFYSIEMWDISAPTIPFEIIMCGFWVKGWDLKNTKWKLPHFWHFSFKHLTNK